MEENSPYADLPGAVPLDPALLKKNLLVQTRIWWNCSVAGSKAKVVSFKETPKGTVVRCNYGKYGSGKTILKWMPCDALAIA